MEPVADFGCTDCWPSHADAAWEARSTLDRVAELIDDSHLHVTVLACSACTQRFLSMFQEDVDWVDGDDPQYWTVLPVTPAEAAELLEPAAALTATRLNALGPGRRSLHRSRPKGDAERISWGTGVSVWA